MKHKKIKSLLDAYLDNELKNEEEKKIVERHLKTCPECASEFVHLNSLQELAKIPLEIELPEEYWKAFPARVRSRIAKQEQKSMVVKAREFLVNILSPFSLTFKVATGITSVIIIVLVTTFYFEQKRVLKSQSEFAQPTVRPTKEKYLSVPAEKPSERIAKSKTAEEITGLETKPPAPPSVGELTSPAIVPPRRDMGGKSPTNKPEDKIAIAKSVTPVSAIKTAGAEKTETEKEEEAKGAGGIASVTRGLKAQEEKYQKGQVSQNTGRYSEAIDYYNLAIAENPKTETAAAAQYQLNIIHSQQDTIPEGAPKIGAGQGLADRDLSTLRRKKEMWERFVFTYSQSAYVEQAYRNLADVCYQLANHTKRKEDITEAVQNTNQYLQTTRDKNEKKIYQQQLKQLKELKRRVEE
ncbi:MAG: zf-HC2 domain-containing protein [Candidatus Edwardsbacteria bacterium]